MSESTLEQARRHVANAEQRVAEQQARIERLRKDGHGTDRSEKVFALFEQVLQAMRDRLTYEEQRAREGMTAQLTARQTAGHLSPIRPLHYESAELKREATS